MKTLRIASQNVWDGIKNLPAWEEMGLDCSAKVRMRGHFRVLRRERNPVFNDKNPSSRVAIGFLCDDIRGQP